ncbi:MAG TPA: tRNA (guanosine(46)-N7)-methyltransferase TrmB [Gemmataceae bacterium]|nr:tRNA (guanosine(46)-N7)-methyltransferase TrmB [Gemmataceae bacterium]
MTRARRLSLDELAPYLLAPAASSGPLSWNTVFGNDHPVEIEVGFGKGLFLLNSAQAQPAVNFVGIEIARKYQLFTATRIAKRRLQNVRLARADAREFLRDFIADGSCQAVHVYFPDPWWKKRHLKRRVFTPEFAGQCERILRSGGLLYIATDVEEYFHVMTGLVTASTKLRNPTGASAAGAANAVDYRTNFERKFRIEGRPIYQAAYEK